MNRRDEKRFRRRWVAGLFARAAVICVFATTAIDASGETETYAPYSARVIYELLRASMHGDSVELRRLLESADPTLVNWRFPSTGETPVFLASVSGHADAVIYLLSKGASPNAYTPAGDGPLLLSSDLGHDAHLVDSMMFDIFGQ